MGRLARKDFFIIIITKCIFCMRIHTRLADQWKTVLFRSAGVHAARWGAPLPGRAPLPHLTTWTYVQAPPSQVTLTCASDRSPVIGRSSQEVRDHNLRKLKCMQADLIMLKGHTHLICEFGSYTVNKIENGLTYDSKRNWHLLLCLSQTVAVSSRERGLPRWPTTWSRSVTVASLPCTSKVRHFLSVWTETTFWCKTMDESSMSLEKWYILPKKSVKKKEKITWLFTIDTESSNKYLL